MDAFTFPVYGRINPTLGSGLVPCGKGNFLRTRSHFEGMKLGDPSVARAGPRRSRRRGHCGHDPSRCPTASPDTPAPRQHLTTGGRDPPTPAIVNPNRQATGGGHHRGTISNGQLAKPAQSMQIPRRGGRGSSVRATHLQTALQRFTRDWMAACAGGQMVMLPKPRRRHRPPPLSPSRTTTTERISPSVYTHLL